MANELLSGELRSATANEMIPLRYSAGMPRSCSFCLSISLRFCLVVTRTFSVDPTRMRSGHSKMKPVGQKLSKISGMAVVSLVVFDPPPADLTGTSMSRDQNGGDFG